MPIEARKIGFRYGSDPWLFRGIDLLVGPGEAVGLVGPSGCGKTTFGRILAGYVPPGEGAVTVDGRTVRPGEYHPVQMIFQHPERAVNPRWRLARTLTEGWKPEPEVLRFFGIEESWLERWPNELSGGELQRICIVRALGPLTQYVIADEMTTMLDAVTQAQIWRAVLAVVRERKLGMLVISHDRHLVERVCDRVVVWEDREHERNL